MARETYEYSPDYAVPPGALLAEHLDARGWSQAEFASRCGRSAKMISEIISGKAPIEPETALQFERVLGLSAQIWSGMESKYQLHKKRQENAADLKGGGKWVTQFPLKDMIRLGCIKPSKNPSETAESIFKFFGVGTREAYERVYAQLPVHYRRSAKLRSSDEAVRVWLRLGELEAERQNTSEYDESKFRHALKEIRLLTPEDPAVFEPAITTLCNEAGVAFVVLAPLSGSRISGVARWLTPHKALIQQSLRYKTDDHFWFTFFHEAAHLLLHAKRTIYVDEEGAAGDRQEVEANQWAGDQLVPRLPYQKFVEVGDFSAAAVLSFSRELSIAPGIVIARLQFDGHIAWPTPLNKLKRKFEFVEH